MKQWLTDRIISFWAPIVRAMVHEAFKDAIQEAVRDGVRQGVKEGRDELLNTPGNILHSASDVVNKLLGFR